MTLIGLALLLSCGFLAVRHFVSRCFVWGTVASLGALIGLGSLTVDILRANKGTTQGGGSVSKSSPNPWSKNS